METSLSYERKGLMFRSLSLAEFSPTRAASIQHAFSKPCSLIRHVSHEQIFFSPKRYSVKRSVTEEVNVLEPNKPKVKESQDRGDIVVLEGSQVKPISAETLFLPGTLNKESASEQEPKKNTDEPMGRKSKKPGIRPLAGESFEVSKMSKKSCLFYMLFPLIVVICAFLPFYYNSQPWAIPPDLRVCREVIPDVTSLMKALEKNIYGQQNAANEVERLLRIYYTSRKMATEWVREADDYQCALPSDTQKVALEELREDKHTREEALRTMRDWIRKNPRIVNCRLDANFLLRFLRCKKFSCPLAQDSLERFLLLRHVYAAGFQNLDMNLPHMKELIDNGYLFAVPERDHLGRRIIVGRPGVFDPYKHTNADMLRIHGITYETLMEDEMNQVHGYVHLGDGAGVGFHYLTLFTPKEAVRIVKNAERTLPMRHKEGHVFNVHPALKFAVDWGLTLISEKMQKRVKVYTSLDDALKNLDPKLLPKEYGGVMPMEEMIRLWKKELEAHRDQLLSHDKMQVRIEMYNERVREGAVSALNMSLDYVESSSNKDIVLAGLNGSFRKLEVD